MIVLSATKSLRFRLSDAVAANECEFNTSYSSGTTPGETNGVSNGVTEVELVGATAARVVSRVVIFNADTASVEIEVFTQDGGVERTLHTETVVAGDSLIYDGKSWKSGSAAGGGIGSVEADANPVLGGNLDAAGKLIHSLGGLGIESWEAETISSGVIAPSTGFVEVNGEGDGTDDLVTITHTSGVDIMLLRADDDSDITIKHNTGNIFVKGAEDLVLENSEEIVMLVWNPDDSKWGLIAGGGGGGGGSTVTETVFTSSGTFSKAAGSQMIFVRAWGGGGSGAASTAYSRNTGGGGGGACAEGLWLASEFDTNESVTIGAGGAAGSGGYALGNAGGTTLVGTSGEFAKAYGGGSGAGYGAGDVNGSGGGGQAQTPSDEIGGFPDGGTGGGGGNSGGDAAYGGGGGGGVEDGVAVDPAGDSIFGGGGGAGYGVSEGNGSRGTSLWGGNGGTVGSAGSVPGGGGGAGSDQSASGAGGDGKVIIWEW